MIEHEAALLTPTQSKLLLSLPIKRDFRPWYHDVALPSLIALKRMRLVDGDGEQTQDMHRVTAKGKAVREYIEGKAGKRGR